MIRYILCAIVIALVLGITACKSTITKTSNDEVQPEPMGPEFDADSAVAFCVKQCEFGPRTMNSEAHERCGEWIMEQFRQYGCTVKRQKADLRGYDGTILKATNIMASINPEAKDRIMLCAHWDSRPWADNDPDEANHKTPVMAANDAASGVAVMLEIARLLQEQGAGSRSASPLLPQRGLEKEQGAGGKEQEESADSIGNKLPSSLGVDFVCFDAEDWGTPQWAEYNGDGDPWALGAQFFAAHLPEGYTARYAILLDMVGGEGAQFHKEGMSQKYAPNIVSKVWVAAKAAGYGSYFPDSEGGYVTDDHVPLNTIAGIPAIDIIPYYPDCRQSSFGPTWHTVNDTMEHIDKNTLKAVGQTIIQVLYTEKQGL